MLKIFYTFILLYMGALILMYVFQRNLIYSPTQLTDDQRLNSNPFNPLAIRSKDGLIIRSWQYVGHRDKKTFILFHGNAGNAADRIGMMKVLTDANHSVILAEYRGYGDNMGKPSEDAIISDAHQLVDKIISQNIQEKDIIFMGRSLGSGVATHMASKYDGAGLILISAYSSLSDVAGGHYPYFPVSFLMKDKFNSTAKIDKVTAPILMFHGENDKIIPIKYGLKLAEATKGEAEFISIANREHNDLNMDEINHKILEILAINRQ